MSTLVVQAHPIEDSLSGALASSVVERLRRAEVGVTERRLHRGDVFDAASLEGRKHLVVVYPTWWGQTPAMLLGPLHELIGPWVDEGRSDPSPLAAVATLTAVTTHGSPRRVNRLQGEPGLQLWKRTILPQCAPRASFEWVSLYGLDQADQPEINRFLFDAPVAVLRHIEASNTAVTSSGATTS